MHESSQSWSKICWRCQISQYLCSNSRKFVEKELFSSAEQVPEKHDLTYYPTVNDLQNHIHQAMKDIEAGILPITAQMVGILYITVR